MIQLQALLPFIDAHKLLPIFTFLGELVASVNTILECVSWACAAECLSLRHIQCGIVLRCHPS